MLKFLPLLLAIATGPLKTPSPIQGFDQIAGTYSGSLFSSGYDMPVETAFFIRDGVITGEYIMNENGTLIPGTLDAFRAAGPFTLECTWHDIYGSGPAGFTFSGDMMSFTGWWGTGEDPEEYYWRGYRSRTEPDQLPREHSPPERN